jgi:serine/threonine-protein kinase
MGDSGVKLPSDAISSHHSPVPFLAGEALAGRQETVLSTGRRPDDLSPLPPPAISPTGERLFPRAAAAQPVESVAGITVGHFVIERRIGAGGMGTVFLARDERLQRPVALKVLAPQQTADPGTVQRFLNEARAAARLDHDHVARVFYYGEDQGLHYIAYEFVQGTNLRELIRARGRLEPAEAVSYAVQLTTALCHFSANGVVHRDIKPSNIIITPQGKAKLVDLGLARKESLEESAQLTVAGTTLGTFDYISPEQAKDPRAVDVRSDVYSLGCTLYHALTGEPPYPEGTVLQRLLDHQDKPPPDPAVKNRRVSPALSAVIRKMMASDPRKRYPTAEDLLHDLLIVAHSLGLRGVATEAALPPSWPTLPRGSRIQTVGWGLTAAAMLVAVLLLNLYPDLLRMLAADMSRPHFEGTFAGQPAAPTTQEASEAADTATESLPARRLETTPANSSRAPAAATATAGEHAAVATREPSVTARPRPADSAEEINRVFDDPQLTLGTTGLSPAVPAAQPADQASSTSRPPLDPVSLPGEGATVSPDPERISSSEPPRTARSASGETTAEGGVSAPFVMAGTGKGYETLDAACAEIREQGQGIIELNFDGRLPTPQRPLRVINKRVTIQAAKGRQPVLWFAPKEPVIDPHQSRMIFVAGGTLSLVNVDLELQVPEVSTADLWALMSCARPDRLRLQGVLATVINPRHHAAALLELAPPLNEGLAKMGIMKEGMPVDPVDIIIDRSLLRGECTGVRLRDGFPIRCDAEYSLFAVGEWLFQSELPAWSATTPPRWTVSLNHNTCLLGNGLYAVNTGDDADYRAATIEFIARNNIFACGGSYPLIDQQASAEQADPRKLIVWTGDRNYFDNWEQFWVVRTSGSSAVERWNFAAWCAAWGAGEAVDSRNDPIAWLRPWRQRRWSEITAEDARLDDTAANNPPRGTDAGRDAGALIEQLPGTGFRQRSPYELYRP